MIFVLSVLALISSVSGNLLINFKKKIGFIIWIISNCLWILVNVLGEPNYPQIVMFFAYAVLNLHGLITWSKEKK